ncbi:MAG: hypothetical protein LBQ66_07490 [Planctomycetaceae bacterium]|nr:hypothetical protein [Planctomycetaceae bacterium]
MSKCIKDNDPADIALAKVIVLITAQPIPKIIVAQIADGLGMRRKAASIRNSLRMFPKVSRFTNVPSVIVNALKLHSRNSLRLLGRVATKIAGPTVVAYGLALAAVETHCAGVCCTTSYYGIDYDYDSMRIHKVWNF